jgi:hypothetical protein
MSKTETDFQASILGALTNLVVAVEEQTTVLRGIGSTMDDAIDVEREKLEFLRSQAGEIPTERDNGDLPPFGGKPGDICDCPGCNSRRLIEFLQQAAVVTQRRQ